MVLGFFNLFRRKKKIEEENPISYEEPITPTDVSLQAPSTSTGSDFSYTSQILISKIETLSTKIDNLALRLTNLEQRISNLERAIYGLLYRR